MKNCMMGIVKNEAVQVTAMFLALILGVMLMFVGIVYSYNKTTYDPILEAQEIQNDIIAKSRAALFENSCD